MSIGLFPFEPILNFHSEPITILCCSNDQWMASLILFKIIGGHELCLCLSEVGFCCLLESEQHFLPMLSLHHMETNIFDATACQ